MSDMVGRYGMMADLEEWIEECKGIPLARFNRMDIDDQEAIIYEYANLEEE